MWCSGRSRKKETYWREKSHDGMRRRRNTKKQTARPVIASYSSNSKKSGRGDQNFSNLRILWKHRRARRKRLSGKESLGSRRCLRAPVAGGMYVHVHEEVKDCMYV